LCRKQAVSAMRRFANSKEEESAHMMNDPIVVWPPGTFYVDCQTYGENYYNCTQEMAPGSENGMVYCCPAW